MKKTRGFTLVEIIVSLAIFSIVAVVALGALVKIVSANKKAQTLQSAITNLNYAMESISREMRVGKTYYCGNEEPNYSSLQKQSCDSGIYLDGDNGEVAYVAFKSPKQRPDGSNDLCSLVIAYKFDFSASQKTIGKWKQDECGDTPFSTGFSPIMDSNVNLDSVYLKIQGDTIPLATMRISGHTGVKEREKTYFDLQTSISPRVGGDE